MIKEKNNLDYKYFNRYLINCGSTVVNEIDLINDFFKEKLNNLPEYEIDPKEMVFLNELVVFCRENLLTSKI